MDFFDLSYTEDGKKYTSLVFLKSEESEINEVVWSEMTKNNSMGSFAFPNSSKREATRKRTPFVLGTKLRETQRKELDNLVISKTAYLTIKWYMPKSGEGIHSVKVVGFWVIKEKKQSSYKINQVYPMITVK